MSAAFCTFDSSDVRFARYKLRATGKNGTTSGTIFSFLVSPGEEEIEVEGREIEYRRGRTRCVSHVFVSLFLLISPSILVSSSFDGLSTISLVRRSHMTCFLKVNTIAMMT